MSATADQALGWRAAGVRRFTGRASTLSAYLAEEFAARPRRLLRAVRLALLVTVGIGVMAAAHVESTLGPYLLWAVAAAPRPMMTVPEAIRLVVTQAVLLALAVPLAGILVEVPWFHVPCFAVFIAAWAYMVKQRNLTNAWMLLGITVIGTLYAVIFDFRGFGWGAAATFGGGAIAFGTILLFDAYLWPDPADENLLEVLAADLSRTRGWLAVVRHAYFDPRMREEIPFVPMIAELPTFLTLLDRADREGASDREKSELLTTITLNERLRLELARLLSLAREPTPVEHRLQFRAEVERVIDALGATLERLHEHVRSRSTDHYRPPAALLQATSDALAALDARSDALRMLRAPGIEPRAVGKLSAFFVGLRRVARLLERTAEYPELDAAHQPPAPRPFYDPEMVRYALKLSGAMAVMLVIALFTQSAEMTAALWTVLIAGLPTHGATVRKMTLRFSGSLVGGVIALAMLMVVTPNFDTVLTYMAVCFLVLLGCAWAAQSSSRLAYAGSQMGTAFVLIFAGLSPSDRVTEPLWRIWAVILGTIVTTVVFVLVWPAYAGDAMLPRLRKLLRLNLSMIPGDDGVLGGADVQRLQAESTDMLRELLAVADDARLEGRHSGVDADEMVHAAGSLRRIAYHLAAVAAGRPRQRPLRVETEQARRALEEGLARRLHAWLDYFEAGRPFDASAAQAILGAHASDGLERTLEVLTTRVAASSYVEISEWPLESRRALLAELDSFDRLLVLTGELDHQLAAIPA